MAGTKIDVATLHAAADRLHRPPGRHPGRGHQGPLREGQRRGPVAGRASNTFQGVIDAWLADTDKLIEAMNGIADLLEKTGTTHSNEEEQDSCSASSTRRSTADRRRRGCSSDECRSPSTTCDGRGRDAALRTAPAIEERLSELESQLKQIDWGGDHEAYGVHKQKWDQALVDMNQILHQIGGAVKTARDGYGEVEQAGARPGVVIVVLAPAGRSGPALRAAEPG